MSQQRTNKLVMAGFCAMSVLFSAGMYIMAARQRTLEKRIETLERDAREQNEAKGQPHLLNQSRMTSL